MRVQTFYLTIDFGTGEVLKFDNLSQVALRRYMEYFDDDLNDPNVTYNWGPNHLIRNENWLRG